MHRQQGGGEIMFWAGIKGSTLVGPYKVPEGMKMNSKAYCEILDRILLQRKSLIFRHDNALTHKAKYTTKWLKGHSFGEDKIMVWPANSGDLNPNEYLWTIIKRRVYQDGRQFPSSADLWKWVEDAATSITPVDVKTLTSSVDSRVTKILKTSGNHVSC